VASCRDCLDSSFSDEEASATEGRRADSNTRGNFNPVWMNVLNEMWFFLERLIEEYHDRPSFSEMVGVLFMSPVA